MREIVLIQMGQCGNRIGELFWQTISDEHNINGYGQLYGNHCIPLQRHEVYYECGQNCRFVPRTVLCDADFSLLNEIKRGNVGKLFNPDYYISSNCGTGNNFAKGFITEGAELVDLTTEIIRKQVERCEKLQGFQMVHSIGGGFGSGAGCLLLNNLRDEYQNKIINTFTVIPSERVSENVTESLNAVLSLNEMIENTNEAIIFDNEAIYDICNNNFNVPRPKICDLNHLIATTMSGITTGFRFPGQLNTDLRKIMTNMCPYEKLKFFIPGYSPIRSLDKDFENHPTVSDLVKQLFNPSFQMISNKQEIGRYLTCATIFRGQISTRDVDEAIDSIQRNNQHMFANWIPNNVKSAICDIPPLNLRSTATFLANTSATANVFRRIVRQFTSIFEKRAFIHWYTGEGMEEEEFIYAKHSVLELCDEYTSVAVNDEDIDDSDLECYQVDTQDDVKYSTTDCSGDF
jgi:tubulin beta